MKVEPPITGEKLYFVDKCLPFGASISCSHFQRFSNALRHITKYKTGCSDAITNYLDDFLFVAPTQIQCNALVSSFLDICEQVNVPVAHEKTELAAHQLVFLGILLDGQALSLCLPEDKIRRVVNWIEKLLDAKKVMVKELEKLVGLLNFFNRAIVPGRAFTRRIYSKFTGVSEKLKPFHHIRIDTELHKDLQIWLAFLTNNNFPKASIARPFINVLTPLDSTETLLFTSDASASEVLGFGCFYSPNWTYANWEHNFIKDVQPSIEFLELYALCMAVFIWIDRLANHRILIFCDNEAVVHMVNNSTSGCKFCMILIRKLVLKTLGHNCKIYCRHITSADNFLSDSLSRLKIQKFKCLATEQGLEIDQNPSHLSSELWPLSDLWQRECAIMIKS